MVKLFLKSFRRRRLFEKIRPPKTFPNSSMFMDLSFREKTASRHFHDFSINPIFGKSMFRS
ncbi:hypothetical protein F1645_10805 [Novacetimonas hansenii]